VWVVRWRTGYVNPDRPSYAQPAALVVKQAAVIEGLGVEVAALKEQVADLERRLSQNFAEFVAAAFLGWAVQASAEEFAAFVWSQAGRPAGPPGWASGEGRCPG
jgi:hypothetical protein